jgi:Tfp pilus assembly protein PilF
MGGDARISLIVLCAVLCAPAVAQQPARKPARKQSAPQPVSDPRVDQAEAALAKGDTAQAEELLKQATAASPKDYRAWYDLGFVYSQSARDAEAKDAFAKALAIKPELFEANLRMGALLLRLQEPKEASAYLRKATALKPEADAQENMAQAWQLLASALEQDDTATAEQRLAAAQKAAELNPENAGAHYRLGKAQLALDSSDGAEFSKAIQLDPKFMAQVSALSEQHLASGDTKTAEALARTILQAQPGNVSAHLLLARVLEKKTGSAAAVAELENAGDAPDIKHELGVIYASQKQYAKAAQAYAAALKADSGKPDWHEEYGLVLMQLKQFPQAANEFIAALKLNPKLTSAYGELAGAASEARDFPLVIKVLDARAAITPETPGTYFLRATAYDNMRQYKDASESYRKFLQVAEGKYPDQEWQARHRLVAIDPKGKK